MFQKRYARRWIAAGLFIVVIGIIAEAMLSITGTPQEQAATWPTVAGEVTQAEIRAADATGATLAAPFVMVDYRYSVGGVTYLGSQSIHRFTSIQEAQVAFTSGQQVLVYYNPNAPLQSLLEPGTPEPAGEVLLRGPRTVLLGTACVASVPFIGIGLALALGGTNLPINKLRNRRN